LVGLLDQVLLHASLGNAVKVTVIATGFNRGARKVAPTPVDLANYVNQPTVPPAHGTASDPGGFYRKTPNPKAAAAGGRFDLDVPAFLRTQATRPASSRAAGRGPPRRRAPSTPRLRARSCRLVAPASGGRRAL
jgi:hypothetical protein